MDFEWFLATIPIVLSAAWDELIGILPYLLLGIALGELLKYTSWTKIIYKWAAHNTLLAVIITSVLGIISPLCTYGTIPVVIELYKSGVKIAPLASFLSASSLMNPQLFIMTAGGISMEMALVRTFAVFAFAVALGLLTNLVPERFVVKKDVALYEDGGRAIECRQKKAFAVRQYLINCFKNLKSVGFYILIGILLGAVIETYIPANWIFNTFKAGRITSILFAALLGVPLYACGGGAIPLVHSMMQQGMGKGSALAFFIVGPATRPAPIMAMAALFRPLYIAGYCAFLIAASVLMGVVYV